MRRSTTWQDNARDLHGYYKAYHVALYNKAMAFVLRRVMCWRLYMYVTILVRCLRGLYEACVALLRCCVGCLVVVLSLVVGM